MLANFSLNAIALFLGLIGFRGIRIVAVIFGILAFDILGIRRKIILKNLDIVFKDTKTKKEKMHLGRMSFISLFTTAFEFFAAKHLFKKIQIQYTNQEYFQNILSKKQGLYSICIHMSNWELLCHVNAKEVPVHVVVKPLGKGNVSHWIEKNRASIGFSLIDRKGSKPATRQIFQAIENQQAIGFIADQKRPNGQMLPFFGRPASTNDSLARLYLKKPAPIIPAMIKRNGPGKYNVIYFPEFIVPDLTDLPYTEKIKEITKKMNSQVESMILSNPTEYFWLHNRWDAI